MRLSQRSTFGLALALGWLSILAAVSFGMRREPFAISRSIAFSFLFLRQFSPIHSLISSHSHRRTTAQNVRRRLTGANIADCISFIRIINMVSVFSRMYASRDQACFHLHVRVRQVSRVHVHDTRNDKFKHEKTVFRSVNISYSFSFCVSPNTQICPFLFRPSLSLSRQLRSPRLPLAWL